MRVETEFKRQIAKIKRRLFFQSAHRVLLHALVIFFAVSIIYFFLGLAKLADFQANATWYVFPMGLSFSVALIIGLATRSNFLNILIDIDRRLKLQDRVSTAYEFLALKKKSEFAELLIGDAAARLRQIKKRQLVPVNFSFLHLLAIILLIVNLLLFSGLFFAPDFRTTRQDQARLEKAGKLLNDYLVKRIGDNTAPQPASRPGHSEKLEQLNQQLKDNSRPLEQRLEALDSFLEAVEGEQARLARELGSRLDAADIDRVPTARSPDLANLSSSQLEKLKGILNRALNNRMPDSIRQPIESLQDLDSIENLLSRIIDDLKDDPAGKDDSVLAAEAEEGPPPQPDEMPEHEPGAPNRSYPGGDFFGRNPDTGERADRQRIGKGRRAEDGWQDEKKLTEGQSNAAGNAKSNAENKPGRDLAKARGSARQDKPGSSPAKTYLIQVRALTDPGAADLAEEEIFRTYRQEVESILQKEDIPVNYREYIKNYFISIGVKTEENAHESQ
ncbi:hypothetical protein D1AOALGA4SA_2618 [Olavius algarvensis Delta 1 endosymbiont]|nr:hypothetical protein D1AOALGA4SA_2618 [Olavius algarvensis Delta 1 endosymbiont]